MVFEGLIVDTSWINQGQLKLSLDKLVYKLIKKSRLLNEREEDITNEITDIAKTIWGENFEYPLSLTCKQT